MTATMVLPHPAVPASDAPPVLVDDHGEFEACLTTLTTLTVPQERALCLDMAAYWAARLAVLVPDLDACSEWAVIARVCQAVAATQRGYVLPGPAAWMSDPHWDELAAGEYDRATVLRALHAAIGHLLPAGAVRVLQRIAASEPVTVDAARAAWVLTPANSPENEARWADLYLAVVGPPPPGSTPLPVRAA